MSSKILKQVHDGRITKTRNPGNKANVSNIIDLTGADPIESANAEVARPIITDRSNANVDSMIEDVFIVTCQRKCPHAGLDPTDVVAVCADVDEANQGARQCLEVVSDMMNPNAMD